MKSKISIAAILILFAGTLSGQVNVGTATHPNDKNKGGRFEKGDIEAVKKTTTVCVLQDKDKSKISEYEKAAEQVWTFNKIEFTTVSESGKYTDKTGYSFITFTGIEGSVSNAKGDEIYVADYFLRFWYPFENKKGKIIEKTIARIELYSDLRFLDINVEEYIKMDKNDQERVLFSDKAVYHNLSPGYIKCYLAVINKYLNEEKIHFTAVEEIDPVLLKELSKDTLFVPEFVLNREGPARGKVSDELELFSKYEFNYKLVSSDFISTKSLNAKKNTFILSYVYSSGQRFLTIYEVSKGTIVYSAYEIPSFKGINGSTSGDFNKISKKIKKLK